MDIKLDQTFWEVMVNTWIVMGILAGLSIRITRGLKAQTPLSRKQHALETIVEMIEGQVAEVSGGASPTRYLPFVGTLFLFVAFANLLSIVPSLSGFFPHMPAIYEQPTAALETTLALAICVLFSVPVFSITRHGVGHWLRTYLQPTPFMLPFNIIGEISRTLALSVRLFGNMMSGGVIGAILLSIAPFFLPLVMQLFGLVTGMIQAYIFAVLAMVYIASAVQVEERTMAGAAGDSDNT